MAYEIPGQRISVKWGTTTPATTAGQYCMYVLDTNGSIILPNTTSFARPLGILQDVPPSTASPGSVMINGVSKVRVPGSTLAKGDFFACSTAGQAVPVSTGFPRVGMILDGTSSTQARLMTGVFYGAFGTT